MEKLIWLYTILVHFLILQYVIVAFSFSVHHLCHHDEGLALLQFKEELLNVNASNAVCGQFSSPKITSWNKSRDCCTWDGVTCHEITGHVISLDLSCSHIEGVISPNSTLFGLSHLQKLNLANNDFKLSRISGRFGGLTQLTHLNLSTSNFNGQIASEISHLSKLVLLDLSYNQGIRFEQHDFQKLFQNLTEISMISLSYVDIASKDPMNLSSSLTYLDLSYTGIHGKLTNHVFELPNMRALILQGNENLTGTLPKFNSSISSMEVLNLGFTKFYGELPDSIGCLKSLSILSLLGCQFSGFVPESIGNLSKLIELRLAFNNFIGQIPASISNSVLLKTLDLQGNQIEGPIPDIFTNLLKLTVLSLPTNNLVGRLPPSVFNLTELESLIVFHNSITGPLPSNAFGLQKLTNLDLSYNLLIGTLPPWLFHLPKLDLLNLGHNQFTGQLQDFAGNSSLSVVFLEDNQLQGSIPKSISTLVHLSGLDLSMNNFSGIVDSNLFSNMKNLYYLELSYNRLVWRIGNDVNMSLPNLAHLGLSSCGLHKFSNFIQNSKTLSGLQLSNNNIRHIPSWLTSMVWDSLLYQNLSRNALSTLFLLPWKSITILNLRLNKLQCPLPISICNL